MVSNENLNLALRNNVRKVLGGVAKKETSEFFVLYRLLTTGDAEMQKERFYEVFGKLEEVNPNHLSKKKFMAWMDNLGINLPELITELCAQTFAHELAESKKIFDCTLQRGVI